MIKDYLQIAYRSIKNRKLRSWLTMIGIFIGIAAVVALISIGQGMQRSINEEFEKLGVDKLIIQSKGELGAPGSGGAVPLTISDAKAIEKVNGIDIVANMYMKIGKAQLDEKIKYAYIVGLPTDEQKELIDEINSYEVELGREIKRGDLSKVVLGINYRTKDIFSRKLRLRDTILINDKEFKIIGFFEQIGNPTDDESIFISEEAIRELYDEDEETTMIMAKITAGEDIDKVAEDVKKALRKEHNNEEGKEDFSVQSPTQLLESFNVILNIMQVMLIGIAGISLIVGGIGIMNTMYTSVLERTQEIGIMKSIGGRNSDVLKIFLFEAGILGTLGGAIGVTIGIILSKIVEIIAKTMGYSILKAYISPWLIIGALAFSFLIGTLSGAFPARQASKMNPVDALRYE